ncbi:SusD/RagB family nutrient-binding outer membrane lipoprotein [Flammeovirga agarivorans]|uniref:SusD/RagB family nutrient-binding outer membrane lipoprotein n=1 Tax=Flammeovirga agarivorans TaxID=2726742 RepID=A0A7X8SJQ7_9BACT|nr:SusD/RagB family nutrient-binding outer membrane lipoprotein [Flammeovirga agarivorans]NLR91530.1 SusD/RagB family nutrient-binding outer membrane lipoprotein [Flammeovirga agarivorans]
MKLRNILIGAALSATALTGCNFGDQNVDPWTSNDLDLKHVFTYTQSKMFTSGHEGFRGNLIMAGPMAQNTACLYSTGIGFGTNDGYTEATWSNIYGNVLKNIEDAKGKLVKQGGHDYMIGQFNVVKVVNMLRLTELYGDIPYAQAGLGYENLTFYPKYDAQKDVLNMMVDDLLDSRAKIEGANDTDISNYDMYDADISRKAQYQKLINSLLIKIGVMMSEADPSRGAEIFKMGYNNTHGYITDWSETSYVRHVEAGGPWGQHVNGSGIAVEGQVGGMSYAYISEVALKFMQNHHDPRLFRVASHFDYSGGVNKAVMNTALYHDFDPFAVAGDEGEFKKVHYRGVRLGDNGDGNRGLFWRNSGDVAQQAAYWMDQNAQVGDEYAFAQEGQFITLTGLNPATFNRLTPSIIIGADEVAFLIAEASLIPTYGVNDAQAFRRGVELALAKYDAVNFPGADFESSFVELYKSQKDPSYSQEQNKTQYVNDAVSRYNAAADKRDVVITEHWIALMGNGYKSFALVTRTGGPSFIPEVIPTNERNYNLPSYDIDPVIDNDAAKVGTHQVVKHRGGVTDFVRPKRFPYPNRELNVNASNVEEAITRQRGNVGAATHFIAIPQWYSKK